FRSRATGARTSSVMRELSPQNCCCAVNILRRSLKETVCTAASGCTTIAPANESCACANAGAAASASSTSRRQERRLVTFGPVMIHFHFGRASEPRGTERRNYDGRLYEQAVQPLAARPPVASELSLQCRQRLEIPAQSANRRI